MSHTQNVRIMIYLQLKHKA